jgi:hypothetical protein
MTNHAYARVETGRQMPGVFEVGQEIPIGDAIACLTLIATCSFDGEYNGQVRYFPSEMSSLVCTHDVRPQAFAPRQRLQYEVQNAIEIPADIFCKKSQKIAVLLQQSVFPTIAPVGCWIGQMLRAIEIYHDTQRFVEEIDFHLTLAIERNWHANVQLKTVFCLGKSLNAGIGTLRSRCVPFPSLSVQAVKV